MFVRKKRNRTGTISVVVVDKSHGGFKEVKNFGVASSEEEADILYMRAREWIGTYAGQQVIDLTSSMRHPNFRSCPNPLGKGVV